LNELFEGQPFLSGAILSSVITLNFLSIDGRALLMQKQTVSSPANRASSSSSTIHVDLTFELSKIDIAALTVTEPLPEAVPRTISRPSTFVSLTPISPPINFTKAQLQVAPLSFGSVHSWSDLGFQRLFTDATDPLTAATIVSQPLPPALLGLNWSVARVTVDARFEAVFPASRDPVWTT
jgi:hypothetical protein